MIDKCLFVTVSSGPAHHITTASGASNVSIQGCDVGDAISGLLTATTTTKIKVSRCRNDAFGSGPANISILKFTNCSDVHVQGNSFKASNSGADLALGIIDLVDSTGALSEGFIIESNDLEEDGSGQIVGIKFDLATNLNSGIGTVTIANNKIVDCDVGMYFDANIGGLYSALQIVNNKIIGDMRHGIAKTDSTNASFVDGVISGNIFENVFESTTTDIAAIAGRCAIRMLNVASTVISGNVAGTIGETSTVDGIGVYLSGTDNVCKDNVFTTVRGDSAYAVRLGTGSFNVLRCRVVGNRINTVTAFGAADDAMGVSVEGQLIHSEISDNVFKGVGSSAGGSTVARMIGTPNTVTPALILGNTIRGNIVTD